LRLTSALEGDIIISSAYITMEWRGQQHAREAVESTASGATAATIATSSSADRMKKVQLIPDWMKRSWSK